MPKPRAVHGEQAGPVIAQVVQMDPVQVLDHPETDPLGAEHLRLRRAAEEASVGGVRSVFGAGERVDVPLKMLDTDGTSDALRASHLVRRDRGPDQRDRVRPRSERFEGQ